MNKRGGLTGVEAIKTILRMVFVMFIVTMSFIAVVWVYTPANVSEKSLKATTFTHRVLNAPLAHVDPLTGRKEPYVVDDTLLKDPKALEKELENHMVYTSNRNIASRIDIYEGFRTNRATVYYNQFGYERLEPLVEQKGAPVFRRRASYPILIQKETGKVPGRMTFEVLQET